MKERISCEELNLYKTHTRRITNWTEARRKSQVTGLTQKHRHTWVVFV